MTTGSSRHSRSVPTDTVNNGDDDWAEQVRAMSDGLGVEVGGHGTSVDLPLQDLWIMDSAITTGLVSTSTTPMLLMLVAQHKLAAEKFATHHLGLDQMLKAYDTYQRVAETKALKVLIHR